MFGVTRRGRRRQVPWRLLTATALGTVLVVAALASYRIGLSQGRIEVLRIEADLGRLRDLNRLMSERTAAAEQQAEAAIARAAQLQQRQRSAAPGPELQRLMTVGAEQLRAGLPVDRLEFLLRHASPGQTCEKAIDSRRVVVHTPVSTGSIASAAFADNRVVVTGEGTAAQGGRRDGGGEVRPGPTGDIALFADRRRRSHRRRPLAVGSCGGAGR